MSSQTIHSFFCSLCVQLWLQPEMEGLRTTFSKLKKLSVCGIFFEFDILWTTAFLVAAASVEKLFIQVTSSSAFFLFATFGASIFHRF
jgi:hypothetical protein